jgi:hypothetical protein
MNMETVAWVHHLRQGARSVRPGRKLMTAPMIAQVQSQFLSPGDRTEIQSGGNYQSMETANVLQTCTPQPYGDGVQVVIHTRCADRLSNLAFRLPRIVLPLLQNRLFGLTSEKDQPCAPIASDSRFRCRACTHVNARSVGFQRKLLMVRDQGLWQTFACLYDPRCAGGNRKPTLRDDRQGRAKL